MHTRIHRFTNHRVTPIPCAVTLCATLLLTLIPTLFLTPLSHFFQEGHSSFLRPHERVVKGSTQTFAALHAAMLKTQRFALAT